ncbi:MAG: hypothetical protein U9N52_09025 [Campylobacterota bacterium]|nr:hypothetical protein [Campylobacterota bacterium]
MLSVIGLALLKTLASFLLEQGLHTTVEYDIENAPYWYYQEGGDQMCTFTYKEGGLESIEIAKKEANTLMNSRIKTLTTKVAYENFSKSSTPKEKLMVEGFKNDPELPIFVNSYLVYEKVKHEGDEAITFVKACIDKESIMTYQTKRLKALQKNIMIHKSDTALDDLEKEFL